jgi:hypothetical protein
MTTLILGEEGRARFSDSLPDGLKDFIHSLVSRQNEVSFWRLGRKFGVFATHSIMKVIRFTFKTVWILDARKAQISRLVQDDGQVRD